MGTLIKSVPLYKYNKYGNTLMTGFTLFVREIFTNPTTMGAAFPSSKKLADSLAEQVPLNKSGFIIELGAGTGVITRALLECGVSPKKLIVIELSATLAEHLHEEFPNILIIQGDARKLTGLLDTHYHPIHTIVSSLPLRSFSTETIKTIGEQLIDVLQPQGSFIQFTYNLFGKPLSPSDHFHLIHSKLIWQNLPPARVETFRYEK